MENNNEDHTENIITVVEEVIENVEAQTENTVTSVEEIVKNTIEQQVNNVVINSQELIVNTIEEQVNNVVITVEDIIGTVDKEIENIATNIEEVVNTAKENTDNIINTVENVVKTIENISDNINENTVNTIFNNITASANNDIKKIEYDLLIDFLKNKEEFNNLINKLSLNLDNRTLDNLENIFKYLSINNVKFNNSPPITEIVNEIKNVFADGKLDLYDVPALINVVNKVITLNLSDIKVKIDNNLISLIIKLIIHILIDIKIIEANDENIANINKLIDSSILLLNTTVNIGKSFACLFCKK